MSNKGTPGVNVIKPKTPELQAMLERGYQMSMDDAKRMIADWEKNPQSWPLQDVKNARAMIAAFETAPVAVDETPGWQREKRRYARR